MLTSRKYNKSLKSFLAVAVLAFCAFAGSRAPSRAEGYPVITPEDIGAHISVIEGPRSATGDAANLARLNEVADYIRQQFTADGLSISEDPVAFGGQTFPNIVGTLRGADCPEDTLIVGAHYDATDKGPGADDNASGVAGVLALAGALSGRALPASIDFTAFAFEEEGLIGSRQMAREAAGTGRKLVGVIDLEMISYTCDRMGCQRLPADTEQPSLTGDFLSVIGNTRSQSLLDHFLAGAAAAAPDLAVTPLTVTGNGETLPDSRRSDHAPFWDAGYPALLISDTADLRNPYYHQAADSLETLNLPFAAATANASLAAIVDVLMADPNGDGRADVCGQAAAATAAPGVGPTLKRDDGTSWGKPVVIALMVLAATGLTSLIAFAARRALTRRSR